MTKEHSYDRHQRHTEHNIYTSNLLHYFSFWRWQIPYRNVWIFIFENMTLNKVTKCSLYVTFAMLLSHHILSEIGFQQNNPNSELTLLCIWCTMHLSQMIKWYYMLVWIIRSDIMELPLEPVCCTSIQINCHHRLFNFRPCGTHCTKRTRVEYKQPPTDSILFISGSVIM